MSKRLVRLIATQQILSTGSAPNVEAVAYRLGVSRRTVFRDLSTLRAAGVRVRFDSSCKENPPQFPADEDLAELLRQAVATSIPCSKKQREQARRAAEALSAMMPQPIRDTYKTLAEHIEVPDGESEPDHLTRIFGVISEGVNAGRCVEILANFEPTKGAEKKNVQIQRLRRYQSCDWLVEGILAMNHKTVRMRLTLIGDAAASEQPVARNLSAEKTDWEAAEIEIL